MRRFAISEMSMEPSLRPGDGVLARRLRRPRRGEIVFFEHPSRPDFWLVKRTIGLPGETVTIADGTIYIDDEMMEDRWFDGATRPGGMWDVHAGTMFVLSDARTRSVSDSRTFGPVSVVGAYAAVVRYKRASR